MDKELTRYLNDHLAGSSAALLLIQEISDNHGVPEAQEFFQQLKEEVVIDQSLLENLLQKIGQNPSVFIKKAGEFAVRISNIKLMWEKVEPGKLGLLEAMEMLALGVEGKRMLWGSLRKIDAWFPEWDDVDFEELDLRAIQQRKDIEFWRIQAARDTLPDEERRARTEEK